MMATQSQSKQKYHTTGNSTYRSMYDGSAVRAPRRSEELQVPQHPRYHERAPRRTLTRTKVQVREPGEVAPFAVIGFLAVGLLATLLLYSYSQNTVLNAEIVSLRSQLNTLQTEHSTLSAQYERVFDMEKVQEAVGDSMIRPTKDQAVYIDLSEPDTVVVYENKEESILITVLRDIGRTLIDAVEYFR